MCWPALQKDQALCLEFLVHAQQDDGPGDEWQVQQKLFDSLLANSRLLHHCKHTSCNDTVVSWHLKLKFVKMPGAYTPKHEHIRTQKEETHSKKVLNYVMSTSVIIVHDLSAFSLPFICLLFSLLTTNQNKEKGITLKGWCLYLLYWKLKHRVLGQKLEYKWFRLSLKMDTLRMG